MPVDPEIAALLPMLAGAPPLSDAVTARAGFRLFTVDMRDPATLLPVRAVEETTVNGRKARIYRPDVEGPTPTILFIHGGGFVIGDLDTSEPTARRLAEAAGCVVVSVDYRLAPEHPAPDAFRDSLAATRWVVEHLD
ncbi:MAG: Alpha/beta hydrolase fold-3 domain protein, partial [Frankiales bacterium]|nr:Alpha/beta hydrolase fold-3 domain protein [Frankiales bacterium]